MHAELLEGLLGYPFARVEHDESHARTGHLTMANPILPLAELVARTRYEDLLPRAIEATKSFIRDTIGVGVGWTWDRVVDKAIGRPDNPLSRAVQLAKFRRCWALAPRPLADADAVIGSVEALDSLADVRDPTALVRSRG